MFYARSRAPDMKKTRFFLLNFDEIRYRDILGYRSAIWTGSIKYFTWKYLENTQKPQKMWKMLIQGPVAPRNRSRRLFLTSDSDSSPPNWSISVFKPMKKSFSFFLDLFTIVNTRNRSPKIYSAHHRLYSTLFFIIWYFSNFSNALALHAFFH